MTMDAVKTTIAISSMLVFLMALTMADAAAVAAAGNDDSQSAQLHGTISGAHANSLSNEAEYLKQRRPIKQMFFITSVLTGKVVTIQANARIPGAVLVMDPPSFEFHLNQLWYTDDWGLLVSVMTNFVLGAEFGRQPPVYQPQVLGCYVDKIDQRDLPTASQTADASQTLKNCRDHCYEKGFKFAGAQFGNECFCGNKYGSHGQTTTCNTPCPGDPKSMCGGNLANTIMATGCDGVVLVPSSIGAYSQSWTFHVDTICDGDSKTACLKTSSEYSDTLGYGAYNKTDQGLQWMLEMVN